jgi:hypothetical protein
VESNLALQLFIATMTVGATVLMHLSGLAGLIALMRVHKHWLMTSRPLWDQSAILLGVAFGLFALHTVEIWAYAALYFSTVTYSTIGYGDLTLPMHWRILGAVEGANGVILLGWSTAFFVSVVARLRALEHDWLGATSEDEI